MKTKIAWTIGCVLLLAACGTEQPQEEEDLMRVVVEVAPESDEIEALLTQAELEVGLERLQDASFTFSRLKSLIAGRSITPQQQARLNTLETLLEDVLADEEDPLPFTGSSAAVKVMNAHGSAPAGYEFVYHETPSLVGSAGWGYYVFLVPIEREAGLFDPVQTFFVSDQGEILTLQ